jgi:hypothetical protein
MVSVRVDPNGGIAGIGHLLFTRPDRLGGFAT